MAIFERHSQSLQNQPSTLLHTTTIMLHMQLLLYVCFYRTELPEGLKITKAWHSVLEEDPECCAHAWNRVNQGQQREISHGRPGAARDQQAGPATAPWPATIRKVQCATQGPTPIAPAPLSWVSEMHPPCAPNWHLPDKSQDINILANCKRCCSCCCC